MHIKRSQEKQKIEHKFNRISFGFVASYRLLFNKTSFVFLSFFIVSIRMMCTLYKYCEVLSVVVLFSFECSGHQTTSVSMDFLFEMSYVLSMQRANVYLISSGLWYYKVWSLF